MDRAAIVEQNFRTKVTEGTLPDGRPPNGLLPAADAVALYRAQVLSRALDPEKTSAY